MRLPPLDMHAHVDAAIETNELVALQAAIFAATRSLDEAEVALRRQDSMTVWGVGCHPGLVGVQRDFSAERFSKLLDHTALAGEIGLDGKSRVPIATQVSTFRSILEALQEQPRIATVHSYAACDEVLELLTDLRPAGIILHWWLGSRAQTARAVELGCYFSVNAAMVRREGAWTSIPLHRLLTETDHPFGDRVGGAKRRPGLVERVEVALGAAHGISEADVRLQLWRNLSVLVGETGVGALLPRVMRRHLASV